MFEPYLKSFFVHSNDSTHIKTLKVGPQCLAVSQSNGNRGLTSARKPELVFTEIAGRHVLDAAVNRGVHTPLEHLNFNVFSGEDVLKHI